VADELGGVTLHCGDALEVLKALPAGIVQTCVTSPPYYGLRDYNVSGQIGLEPTPAEYVARLVAVFGEVRRVLRDDGTLWLNLGDSYASTGGANLNGNKGNPYSKDVRSASFPDVKPKDLLGIPWMVAFALRADGWYLRQDIVWSKPNPMPESVRDRCTKAHEYLFLLSKKPSYYFDAEAIAEASAQPERAGTVENTFHSPNRAGAGRNDVGRQVLRTGTRNRRSVWTVTPTPFPGAHFAVMPPELVRPCVLAGCPAGGVVLDPFAGSGTTLAVAVEERRRAVGIELNPEYHALIRKRLRGVTPALV